MKKSKSNLWEVFWNACKETPAGMIYPIGAFFGALVHNPVTSRRKANSYAQ